METAEWITPKTDWSGSSDSSGNYTGDYFNYTDYNRIKNNLSFLHGLSEELYPDYDIEDMGDDKTVSDYVYADEINTFENNLVTINENTYNTDYGTAQSYLVNGAFIDYNELNRIESAMLNIYTRLNRQYTERRRLPFRLGKREEFG